MESKPKVIVVTGGSKGLGQGFVRSFLQEGHIVATFSRSQTPFIKEMQNSEYADRFYWEKIDMTDFNKVNAFIKKVFKKFGKIDGLINNAGMLVQGVLTLMNSQDISNLVALNLEACIRTTQSCVKCMLQQGSGSIINISSLNAIRGNPGVSVYSATKAGIDGFTRSLARELGPRSIRVNSIAPGYVETEMTSILHEALKKRILKRTPLGRLGTVEDIVNAARFLISDESQFITGQTLSVDGGITC